MSVRWGFLGAGAIAQTALSGAVHEASNAKLYAVASRDAQRSWSLSPEVVFDTYQDLLDDPNVDAVYISLANHQHFEWVIHSLEAGKHVLCEKPLGLNALEALFMAQAAEAAGKLLVEAVWSRWHPRFRRLIEIVQSGEIGEVSKISTAFTFEGSIDGNYRANPRMGGGALLDVGVYEVHAWVGIGGCTQELTLLSVDRSLGASGVDLTTKVSGLLANSVTVESISSFEQPEFQQLEVVGSKGSVSMLGDAAFTSWKTTSALSINDREETFPAVDAYQIMVEQVSAKILGDPAWVLPIAESVRVAQIVNQIATS
jgi:xylose dehydrogenase (NAD/NADP)